jgi:riboflavin kinase/FMN adenylyltransferase
MELIRGLYNLRPRHRGCVATIGNFDGIHLGHQAVLGQLSEQADELGLPLVVITFEPYPQEFFSAAGESPPRLTRFREKLQALRRYGVDRVLTLRFDKVLSQVSAEAFIEQLLIKGLDVRYLVVGDDFRFGHRRQGDVAMLRTAGDQHGFQVVEMHTFDVDGERVSSTRVREALGAGELNRAAQLLGRSYRMSGRVVQGDQRGRTIGFPTANIHLHRRVTPLRGVYAVEMFGLTGDVESPIKGVANIGHRPTVSGTRCQLEVHLFDFDREIYGEYVQVEFIQRLRDEKRFDSFTELKTQIEMDAAQARALFEKNSGSGDDEAA